MGDKVKVRSLDAETQETLIKLFRGSPQGFARFGEGGYLLSSSYEKYAGNVKTIPVRPDDVWVATFPRSGTFLTQELVWLLMNEHDYETALKIPLARRYLFVVLQSLFREDKFHNVDDEEGKIPEHLKNLQPLQELSDAPSPRFMYTHLALSLLPDDLLDTTKVVYVARDPRDVAVSFYHLSKFLKGFDYVGDFKTFWNLFVNDSEAWSDMLLPRVYYLWARACWTTLSIGFRHCYYKHQKYSQAPQNLSAAIERIAKFLGKEVTCEQMQKLCEHLDIKNFKNNASVNPTPNEKFANPGAVGFVRKGKSGGWREHFDEEMAAQAQRWMRAQLADTDLRFAEEPAPK